MAVHDIGWIGLDVQCSKICSDIMQGHFLDVDRASGTLKHSCGCVPGNSGAALIVAEGCGQAHRQQQSAEEFDREGQLFRCKRENFQVGHGLLFVRLFLFNVMSSLSARAGTCPRTDCGVMFFHATKDCRRCCQSRLTTKQ